MSVCLSTGGDVHVTITHDTLDLTVRDPLGPILLGHETPSCMPPHSLVLTSDSQDWRPVQICSFEGPHCTACGSWNAGLLFEFLFSLRAFNCSGRFFLYYTVTDVNIYILKEVKDYIVEAHKCKVNTVHFCETIKTRNSSPMFWPKLYVLLNIMINS